MDERTFWFEGKQYKVLDPTFSMNGFIDHAETWKTRKTGTPSQKGKPFKERSGRMAGAIVTAKYKPRVQKVKVKVEKPRIERKELRAEKKIIEKKRGLQKEITIKEKKPRKPRVGKKYTIDSLVRKKYEDYLDNLLGKNEVERKRRGKGVKRIPIGAFQKYYESRRAYFETKGVQRDIFDDKFSNLDMASIDGLLDLDSRLAKYFGGQDYKSTTSEIAEHYKGDKKMQELYRGYYQSEVERLQREGKAVPEVKVEIPLSVRMAQSKKYSRKWKVPSHTTEGKAYVVSQKHDGGYECSCWKWIRTRQDCHHIGDVRANSDRFADAG